MLRNPRILQMDDMRDNTIHFLVIMESGSYDENAKVSMKGHIYRQDVYIRAGDVARNGEAYTYAYALARAFGNMANDALAYELPQPAPTGDKESRWKQLRKWVGSLKPKRNSGAR